MGAFPPRTHRPTTYRAAELSRPRPHPCPEHRFAPGSCGGTSAGLCGAAGREHCSLRPFIPASPKRICFDVQPGFLWVWSEPVQPSLGDTPLSKSYIFYITSFPAWLFFFFSPPSLPLLMSIAPSSAPSSIKSREDPPSPHLLLESPTLCPAAIHSIPWGRGAQPAQPPRPQRAAALSTHRAAVGSDETMGFPFSLIASSLPPSSSLHP